MMEFSRTKLTGSLSQFLKNDVFRNKAWESGVSFTLKPVTGHLISHTKSKTNTKDVKNKLNEKYSKSVWRQSRNQPAKWRWKDIRIEGETLHVLDGRINTVKVWILCKFIYKEIYHIDPFCLFFISFLFFFTWQHNLHLIGKLNMWDYLETFRESRVMSRTLSKT